jgi:adenine-specific DNA-methyltransferase
MPTLNWLGKDKVINHHQDVPFRVLDRKYGYGADSGNILIHGDNLDALKALLPRFEGRVKCVCIDPPYNTGNEGWVYNDNVNDPKIKKWLGEAVGREGEDLSRHDKWLCMMYPRLRLLQRLLAADGAIFISIGDDELSNLKAICNEIFGATGFVANIAWQRTYSPRNDSKGIPSEAEWILVYGKQPNWNPQKLERTAEMDARYSTPDNDARPWKSSDASAPGAATHTGMVYAIQHPLTGKMLYPTNGRHWAFGQEQNLAIMQEWAAYELRPLDDYEKRKGICGKTANVPETVSAIVLSEPFENVKEETKARYGEGNWPMLCFSDSGRSGIRRKSYLDAVAGRIVTNFWSYGEVGHTDEASKELKGIFGGAARFDTPKPTRLIERILQIATNPGDIVLDSFAGSGTTAHAVLNLNKAGGGNRRFILVEMEDYAETITAERVRRVIDGYAGKPGTGGGFAFYELGEPLMHADGSLNEAVPAPKICEYVWHSETKTAYEPQDAPCFLGVKSGTAYYFNYERGEATALDEDFLRTIAVKAPRYVVYADVCALSAGDLERFNITFKKIPRDISRL